MSAAVVSSPRAGVLARRVDEVIGGEVAAGSATAAERARAASRLSCFGAAAWRPLQLEDCAWLAFMLLRLEAQFAGRWAAAAAWRRREDAAMRDTRRAERGRQGDAQLADGAA